MLEIIVLVHVINSEEVSMDSSKHITMAKWLVFTKKEEVETFLGFTNYICHFIVQYTANIYPLIYLTKDIVFTW